jgi:hypothetical protein
MVVVFCLKHNYHTEKLAMLLRIFFFAKLTTVLVKLASVVSKLPNAFVKLQVSTKTEKIILVSNLAMVKIS